jgi:hypothetical protein
MSIRVRDKGTDFVPAPMGLQRAVCCDVVEMGLVETSFGKKRKVRLCFQSEHKMDNGKPFIIQQRYTATLHKKGMLRPALEGWRGKPLTEAEANDFDLEVLIGKNCQILVVHNTKDGITYGNIQSIVPAAKGVPALTVQDYTRVQDRDDYVQPDMGEEAEPGQNDGPPPLTDDDIPF